ncbi:hypothetical protein KZZ52_51830 [Dactylosporangium sp. AC04546]|uniref:hypothetical protein n=1 Tax=Dactylosporangium sp. AC04546 TaxID=2862460 RepID=UPI001EE13D08|nr:hypothetical protein [Dactylosporangium sp. AC04546]WVK82352.1 hypothetical protein KZZ52_51830 [Dactylosporangium sp. AC04546]
MDEPVRVPGPGAGIEEVSAFAHTYHGYALHEVNPAPDARDEWNRSRTVGDDVDTLRACLFFEARANRFGGGFGRFERDPFIVALIARIRELSGGFVPKKP